MQNKNPQPPREGFSLLARNLNKKSKSRASENFGSGFVGKNDRRVPHGGKDFRQNMPESATGKKNWNLRAKPELMMEAGGRERRKIVKKWAVG